MFTLHKMVNEKQFSFAISKIKELAFSISQIEDNSIELEVGFGINVKFDLVTDFFDLHVLVDLKSKESKKVLVHITVLNSFYIENIKRYLKEDGETLDIPDLALVTLLSLSVSHTRAILAKNTAGTAYENHLIPVINPTEMAKEVFKIK